MFERLIDWCYANDLLISAVMAKVIAGVCCATLQFGFGIG